MPSKSFTQPWRSKLFALIFLAILCTACEDEPTQLGQELLRADDLVSTQYTDTLTVNSKTVLLDSVVTSTANHLLVGRYIDPVFGAVEASSYFQIANIDSIKNVPDAVLDSVVLSLGYKYYHGDTLKPQSISVHRVLDKIGQNTGNLTKRLLESLNTKNTYYNTDKLSYDSQPLGQINNFKAKPVIQRNKTNSQFDSVYSSLNIRLKPEFGNELLALRGKKAGSGLIDFKEYFKGMVLVPNPTDNAAILGFEPNNTPSTVALKPSYLGLYYHSKDKKDTLKTFFLVSFTTNETYNNRFNHIKHDRSNTPLVALVKPNDKIPAKGAAQEVYVQSGSGISAKIEIPHLKTLVKDGNIAINKVELALKPVAALDSGLPVIGLNMINVNPTDTNRPWRTATGELFALASEGGNTGQLALYNTKTKSYQFNITTYVQQVLSGVQPNNGFILSSANDHRVNRLILDKTSMKLRVFYTKLGK
jgi:hypothetical protein